MNIFKTNDIPIYRIESFTDCFISFEAECYVITMNELIGFVIILVQIVFLIKRHKKVTSKQQLISIILFTNILTFIIFNLIENITAFYFHTFTNSIFQLYITYYFGSKLNYRKLEIKTYCFGCLIFTIVLFLICLFKNDSLICNSNSILILNSLMIINSFIFLIISIILTKKIQEYQSQKILLELNQLNNTQKFQRHNLLIPLAIINFSGSILLIIINSIIFSNKYEDCRLIQHYGDNNQHNSSDIFNSIIISTVQFIDILIPSILITILFMPKQNNRKKISQSQIDVEQADHSFFTALTISFHARQSIY